jgi:hypothetical protein
MGESSAVLAKVDATEEKYLSGQSSIGGHIICKWLKSDALDY